MNTANELLKAVQDSKRLHTKAYNNAKEKLRESYQENMRILNKEEKRLLKLIEDGE